MTDYETSPQPQDQIVTSFSRTEMRTVTDQTGFLTTPFGYVSYVETPTGGIIYDRWADFRKPSCLRRLVRRLRRK